MKLIRLQVHAFMNRSNEMSLRLIALDHLGVIAARLRHDAIISMEQDHDELINILAQVRTINRPLFCIHVHVCVRVCYLFNSAICLHLYVILL